MKRMSCLACAVVLLLATPALAQFGGLGGVKVPKKPTGNAEDMNKFVKASDSAYADVRDLASAIPEQVSALSDGVLGLKDMPLDDTAKEKVAGLKKELDEAAKAVRSPRVHEVKLQKEAHARLDKAMDGLMGFMKETMSQDTAKKALGLGDLTELKAKAQAYLEEDLGKGKGIAEKLVEAGKLSPAAATAYGIGLADDYTVTLTDGTKAKAKELDELVKGANDNMVLWKGFSEKRVEVLKGFVEMIAGGK